MVRGNGVPGTRGEITHAGKTVDWLALWSHNATAPGQSQKRDQDMGRAVTPSKSQALQDELPRTYLGRTADGHHFLMCFGMAV